MKKQIALILIGLFATGAFAQSRIGMHKKDGTWAKPTMQSALDAIMLKEGDNRHRYAVAVLRQKFDQWPASALDAFAEELGRIFVQGSYSQSSDAGHALQLATIESGEGIPYTKSRDVFIRIYESVRETDLYMGKKVLSEVFYANGEDYVRDLFHGSTKPEKACSTSMRVNNPDGTRVDPRTKCPYLHEPWCVAGRVLVYNQMWDPQLVEPLATDPTPDDILPHCFGQIREGDKWPLIVY